MHNETFDKLLIENGYPQSIIQESKNTNRGQTNRRRIGGNPFYIKVPFVNNEFNRRLKGIFYKHGFNVRFCYPNRTLRSILSQKRTGNTCHLTNCTISSSGLCLRSRVVYQIKCPNCLSSYIGSTIRPFHIRVKEHLSCNNSSVFRHLQHCPIINDPISVSVLAYDSDPVNLRLKEALFIRERLPNLNSREEIRELDCLI